MPPSPAACPAAPGAKLRDRPGHPGSDLLRPATLNRSRPTSSSPVPSRAGTWTRWPRQRGPANVHAANTTRAARSYSAARKAARLCPARNASWQHKPGSLSLRRCPGHHRWRDLLRAPSGTPARRGQPLGRGADRLGRRLAQPARSWRRPTTTPLGIPGLTARGRLAPRAMTLHVVRSVGHRRPPRAHGHLVHK